MHWLWDLLAFVRWESATFSTGDSLTGLSYQRNEIKVQRQPKDSSWNVSTCWSLFPNTPKGKIHTHTGRQASQSEVWALALSQDKWLQDFGPGFLLWLWVYEIRGIYSQFPVQRSTVENVTWKTWFKMTKTAGTPLILALRVQGQSLSTGWNCRCEPLC